jgi:uncharacterized iron-regulated membrane protein
MTGVGVTLYLVLAMHNYVLAALVAGLFAPLIGFHLVITLISKRDSLVRIEVFEDRMKTRRISFTKT